MSGQKKKRIKPRPTQTKVKHAILENYLKSWGGIIIHGLKRRVTDLHFVYIDCNASFGRFDGELGDDAAHREKQSIPGSPIIGINTLDSLATWARTSYGVNIRTNAILFENDPGVFKELKRSLEMADLSERVRETDDFFSLRSSEIALLCEDSTSMASRLLSYTQYMQPYLTFSFFALDPYGPKGIPLSFVGEIWSEPK